MRLESLRTLLAVSGASLLLLAASVQACGGDEDSEVTGQGTDGGDDGTGSSSGSTSSSSSGGTGNDGGGLDAIADSPQATPLCNIDGGFGCVAPTKCDPALGCVQCASNGDCASMTNKICVRGSCDQCGTNADCTASGTACYPRDHQCHANCVDAGGNCGNRDCDPATGQCVGCLTNNDCSGTNNPYCDQVRKQCVKCTQNSECTGANKYCHPTELVCVQCLAHSECPALDGGATQVCDPVDFRCRGGCFGNGDCGGSTPTCNLTTLRCGCSSNTDCANNPTSKFCNTTINQCVECLAAGDCNADAGFLNCNNNRCVGCLTENDCSGTPSTPHCNTTTGKCVECVNDTQCTQNPRRTCSSGTCVK